MPLILDDAIRKQFIDQVIHWWHGNGERGAKDRIPRAEKEIHQLTDRFDDLERYGIPAMKSEIAAQVTSDMKQLLDERDATNKKQAQEKENRMVNRIKAWSPIITTLLNILLGGLMAFFLAKFGG